MNKKPRIDKRLRQHSHFETALFIAYCASLCFLPSIIAHFLFTSPQVPLWLSIFITLPCIILSAAGFHLLAYTGHEGMHGNLHPSKKISFAIGVFTSSPLVVFSATGFSLHHWAHHAATNTSEDPDRQDFFEYKSFFSRAVWGRLKVNRQHNIQALRLITHSGDTDPHMQKYIPFNADTMKKFAILNFSLCSLWALFYFVLALHNFTLVLFIFIAPILVSIVFSGLRPYLEHTGTGLSPTDNARSRTHWLWTLLEGGANFHHEHHLYPGVPQWRLPSVSKSLRAHGFVSEHSHPGFLSAFQYATRRYDYIDGELAS